MKVFNSVVTKRLISVVLVLCLLSMTATVSLARNLVLERDQPRVGVVIDIIDGEAIKVLYFNTLKTIPVVEQIKLIGIDSNADDDAFNYMRNQLLGEIVFVLKEDGLPETDGFYNAYIYQSTDMSLNEIMLKEGRVALDKSYEESYMYPYLVETNSYAVRHELGIYEVSSSPRNFLNVNTASFDMLKSHLDISDDAALGIISMRTHNPINDLIELGFAHEEIDKEFLMNNYKTIHFVTNINDASLYEMASLFNSDEAEQIAFDVNQYILFKPFAQAEDIKNIPSAKYYYYMTRNFITMDFNDNMYHDPIDHKKVNINTATAEEIRIITGFNIQTAANIVYARDENNYTFKSISELSNYGYPWYGFNMNVLMDDLTVITDLNEASEYEIGSLFSSGTVLPAYKNSAVKAIMEKRPFDNFDQVKMAVGSVAYHGISPFISLYGERSPDVKAPININTNPDERVFNHIGLTLDYQKKYEAHVYKYLDPEDLDFNQYEQRHEFSLFTNINAASFDELLLLHPNMTEYIAKKIISYRSEYPFYSLAEVEAFFKDVRTLYIYNDIKNYIVFY